jgi:SAM-dependent methyltransferase
VVSLKNWMDPDRIRERASSFGPAAALYDRVRPTYPAAAVDWALGPLGPGRWRILDVGAGTGIMTRLLLSLGHDTIAVEPDEKMRQRLTDTTDARSVSGTAEAMPLGDGSVDGAIAAQAYHWFDQDRANAELARVIRPGGVIAAVWNVRDESVDWVNQYSLIVEGDRGPDGTGADSTGSQVQTFGEKFGPVETELFRHSVRHTPDSLVSLLKSRSYFLTATPERQAELEREVHELATQHPDLADNAEFDLSYVTKVYRAKRV